MAEALIKDIGTIAYTAGIIDGEGCISIGRATHKSGKMYHRISVRVSNTDRGLLNWLQHYWGGSIHFNRPSNPERDRPQFSLCWLGKTASNILQLVRPYLIVKARQADLALSFQRTLIFDKRTAYGMVTTAIVAARDKGWAEMRKLNRKGMRAA